MNIDEFTKREAVLYQKKTLYFNRWCALVVSVDLSVPSEHLLCLTKAIGQRLIDILVYFTLRLVKSSARHAGDFEWRQKAVLSNFLLNALSWQIMAYVDCVQPATIFTSVPSYVDVRTCV